MLNEKISMSLISFQPGESVIVYCVPSHMIVSAFCFILFFFSYMLSSFAPTAVGGKIHCSELPSVNIHCDHLREPYPLF